MRTGVAYERRSTPLPVAPGTTARPPHGGASGLGVELPATRHSRAGRGAAAQAARQPFAKQHQVFCNGGRFRNYERPRLARQSHQHHLPALAKTKRPQKRPSLQRRKKRSRFSGGGLAAPSKTLFFPPCGKLRVSDTASASG